VEEEKNSQKNARASRYKADRVKPQGDRIRGADSEPEPVKIFPSTVKPKELQSRGSAMMVEINRCSEEGKLEGDMKQNCRWNPSGNECSVISRQGSVEIMNKAVD